MIVVTGATGEYGTHVINHLLNKGVAPSDLAALVRNEEKAAGLKEKGIALRKGDYMNYASLVKAFEGVDKLLFVSGSEVETREEQHRNVVNAAKEAGVGHVVYTSFLSNTPLEESAIAFLQETHAKTEKWLKESGLTYTILQNALYMDMIPMFAGENVLESGVIMQPAEQGKSSSVLREDLAEAAAVVLTTEGHENKTYPLANNEAVSYQDIAEAITAASGKKVTYTSPSPEEFKNEMKKYGVPDEYIGMFTAFSVARANGELEVNDDSLEKLLGRKPVTAREFISRVYG
ncbi:SDR family oxidoreductase [Roseivirga sp. BDSF3-8]|uniref:SDR family oxidoreductase n=1 Tax=Roseivirga sp. BDSF3-8 TaxID=3241598 RepID=UPI003532402A